MINGQVRVGEKLVFPPKTKQVQWGRHKLTQWNNQRELGLFLYIYEFSQ
jgi:hypothetical protein